jgi:hypothetical protein
MRRMKLGFPQTAVLVFFPAPATARVVSSKLHAHRPVTIIVRDLTVSEQEQTTIVHRCCCAIAVNPAADYSCRKRE